MRQLHVNGVSLTYCLHGPSDPASGRPPLVLLHGFPLDARVWADVARITSSSAITCRPNLRGFGSLTSIEPFTIDSLAAELAQMLRQLELEPCILAGLSMGGYVALSFAEQFPQRLAGLALVDTRAGPDDEAAKRRRDETIELVRRSGVSAVVGAMHSNLLASQSYRLDPALAEALMRIMLDTAGPTIENASRAMRDRPDRTHLLPKIQVPATVIVGEEDRITPPEAAHEMADALPQGRLVIIPGAGHLTPLEQPQAVAEALLELLARARGAEVSRGDAG